MIQLKHSNNNNQNLADEDLSSEIWVHTPLHDFRFKCMMSKYDLYTDVKCRCLCHPHNQQ